MLDSNQNLTPMGGSRNNGTATNQVSSMISPLAREVGKYATLFLFASIVGSYVYNSVYFSNIDGELYFNTFLPLLSYNDYISTMFSFIPPAAMIFTCAIVGKSLLEFLLRKGTSTLLEMSEKLPKSRVEVVLTNKYVKGVVKNALFPIAMYLFYASYVVHNIQPKYNWALLFVSVLSLAIYVNRHNWAMSLEAKGRVIYAVGFVTVVICVLSAIVGLYRFELSLNGKKEITLEYQGRPIQVSAARVLEKGVFFIIPSESSGYVAHLAMYEGGLHFCRKVVSDKSDQPFWRRIFYKWPSSKSPDGNSQGNDCRLG